MVLLKYLMQGEYERKKDRLYDYCIILGIRITRYKNDMKDDKRPYDYGIIFLIRINRYKNDRKKDKRPYNYDIILLIRIIACKKNGKRKTGATKQQESHGMDRKIIDQEEDYKKSLWRRRKGEQHST